MLIALSAAGCGSSQSVDRASAEADDEERSSTVEKPSGEAPAGTTSRMRGIRPLARAERSLTLPVAETSVIASPASHASPQADVGTLQRPMSSPIPTPLPTRTAATHAAETVDAAITPTVAAASNTVPASPTIASPIVSLQSSASTPTAVPHDATPQLRRAEEYSRRGIASAAKGAAFTARAEFLESLRMVAAANDARSGTNRASTALTAGLNALLEAEDFVGRASQRSAPLDVAAVVRTHRTAPYLAPSATRSASTARDAYLRFAKEQLAFAVGGSPTGSIALHGLGKVHASGNAAVDSRGKAQTYYEAALTVGPDNFLAANDLAVLLAEDGQLERARDVLHAGLRRSPQPAMWNNLAAVHDRLGQAQLAEAARQESRALQARAAQPGSNVLPTNNVVWLDSHNFAATSRLGAEGAGAPPAAVAAAAPIKTPTDAATSPTGIRAYLPSLGGSPKSNVVPASAVAPIRTVQQPTNRSLVY